MIFFHNVFKRECAGLALFFRKIPPVYGVRENTKMCFVISGDISDARVGNHTDQTAFLFLPVNDSVDPRKRIRSVIFYVALPTVIFVNELLIGSDRVNHLLKCVNGLFVKLNVLNRIRELIYHTLGDVTFDVEINSTTKTTMEFAITPSNLEADYFCTVMDKAMVDEFPMDQYLVSSIYQDITEEGAAVGERFDEYMPLMLDKGIIEGTFKGLATGIEYKMKVTNGTWDKSWGFDAVKNAPAGVKADNDGNIVFHMAAAGNVIVAFDGANITLQGNFGQGSVTPGLPTVVLAGEMNEWSTTANKFVPAKDSLTASVSVNLEAKTYQFKVVVDNTWQTNISATMTRNNCTNWAFSVMDGEETNAKITADVAGSYTFVWTYATNSLSVIYPSLSAVEDVQTKKNATKYIQNGQLYIIRDGVRYNSLGQVVE